MPWRSPKLCAHVGCSQLTHERWCKRHKQAHERARGQQRGTAAQRGYGSDWQRIRAAVIQAEPICRKCRERQAVDVDHIVPLHRGGTNDPSNLAPMCRGCHNRKGRER